VELLILFLKSEIDDALHCCMFFGVYSSFGFIAMKGKLGTIYEANISVVER